MPGTEIYELKGKFFEYACRHLYFVNHHSWSMIHTAHGIVRPTVVGFVGELDFRVGG